MRAAFSHRIFYKLSHIPIALESNRHTNRHTTLLRISDLLEPASVKGLRRVGEIPLSTVWDFGGFMEMAICYEI
jgi:hypothetical protein